MTTVAVHEAEIFAGSVDGTVRRFDLRMGRTYTDDVHHAVTSVAVTRDGMAVLVACLDNSLRLLDKREGLLLGSYRGHVHNAVKMDCALVPSDAYAIGSSETGGHRCSRAERQWLMLPVLTMHAMSECHVGMPGLAGSAA